MIYLYNSTSFNPYHNLAIEDFFVDYVNHQKNCFIVYFWQNENTVVIGRNQDAFCECNLDNLKKYNGHIARRKTGGGAVFHDKNNLNFSFVVPKEIFNKKNSMEIIKNALLSLGLNATVSGRNDVLVDSMKCSGNAYLNKNNAVLHHGTILLNTNINLMQLFLNVHTEKLKSKGVKSVKSRVVNLQTIDSSLDAQKVKNAILLSFKNTYKMEVKNFLLNDDLIKERERFYSEEAWIYGDKKFIDVKKYDKKFDWGLCSLKILQKGKKTVVKVYSDSLESEKILRAERFLNNMSENILKNVDDEIIVEIFEFYKDVMSLQ